MSKENKKEDKSFFNLNIFFINKNIKIMKKNFLLLMLMALLPLSGWALTDLTGLTVIAVGDVGFGSTTAPSIRITYDGAELSNSFWEIEGYYETNDGTGTAVELSTLPVGATRYVKINYKSPYTGSDYGVFEVTKAPIVATVTPTGGWTKVYKAADPIVAADNVSATLRGTAIASSDLATYLTIDATALAAYTYTGEAVSATGYPVTLSGISLVDADNYELTITQPKMVITAKEISTASGSGFTFTSDYTAAYTYNAAEQRPTYTIKWDHDNDAATAAIELVEGTDYEVAFNNGTDDVDSPVNAATSYSVKVNGKGNYSGTDIAVTAFAFVIDKAPLSVMALPKTKVYDGQAWDATTAQYNISGRVGTDASKAVTGITTTVTAQTGVTSPGVGKYDAVATIATDAKVGDVKLSDNYTPTVTTTEWEITKRPVTLTIADAEMGVGASSWPELPAKTASVGYDEDGNLTGDEGAVNASEKSTIETAYTVKLLNGTGETYATELAAANSAAVGEYAEAYTATASTAPANYDVTVVKSKLTVKGAAFTVMPVVASDIEYGDDYTIGYYTAGTIDESKLVFVIGETEYKYSEKDSWTLPTARGNYNVTIKEGTAVGTGTSQGGTATLSPTAYNINKKQLTLTVADQTVTVNDDAESFLTGLQTKEGAYTIAEDIDDELTLVYSLDAEVIKVESGKITGFQTGKSKTDPSIKVALGDDEVSANYDITGYTIGKLDISTDLSTDLAAATAVTTIAEAVSNGSEYDVTITGRTLNANAWNVMVLPFKVKALDFCNTIGTYAVFNTLKSVEKDADDASKDKIYFQLQMEEIPANQPFLVKPLAAVDFDEVDASDNKIHVFKGVKFVAADAQPKYTGVDGAVFTGNYEASYDIPSTNYWALQSGTFNHFTEGLPLGFLRGYIELTSGAPAAEFFVEDLDANGATAIKSLNVETMQSVDADGWYTIGGVKLQGAPVEKGVYINNGKKVVIK